MANFRLTLLGAFALSGVPRAALSKKAQALLAYLAMPAGQPHARDKLASMLWSDRSEEAARQNLRQCLAAIRKAGEASAAVLVIAEGDLLRLDTTKVTVDACEFEQAVRSREPQRLARTLSLYQGDLLEGLHLQGEPFEEWLNGERRRLRASAIEGLSQLLAYQRKSGAREDAMQTALRLLAIDPLQEGVHRSLMHLYHETGNAAQALRQYAICEKVLRRELNVEPEAATKDLRRDILRSRSESPRSTSQDCGSPGRSGNLPPDILHSASRSSPPEGDVCSASDRDRSVPSGVEILRDLDAPIVPSDRPSVAILPFRTDSSDPRYAYFADGLCEDIITSLSGVSRLMVIARSSSFAYKGKEVDAKQVGRELGVAHILEGSVRASGDRLRISAHLVHTSTGGDVWADHYDRNMGDAFAVQDEITQEIVTALEVKLTHGERIRTWRRDAVSLDAYQHFTRAREAHLTFSRSGAARAREHIERAIAINPRFATAHAFLGLIHASEARFRWTRIREDALLDARNAARTALSLDARCAMAHMLLTYVAMQDRRFGEAISEGECAVALQPSDAGTYHMLAMARSYNGEFAEGARLEQRALRLSPLTPENSLVELGRAYFHMGWFDDAATVLQRVCRTKPNWLTAWTILAGCYAEGGRPELSKEAGAQVLRIRPDFSIASWADAQLYRRKEDLERHLSSLRALGLPESTNRNPPTVSPQPFSGVHDSSAADLPAVITDRPSLAVLPFDNLSEDRALSLVADGLVEDVITLLARVPGFFIISRRSSFVYRDRSLDVREVSRELGVRYVVAGSIRGSDSQVRIVVNLFEAESGKQHWARQYVVERVDALEIQDRIAGDIIVELEPELVRAELTKIRRRRPSNLDAWSHYHQAVGAIALVGVNDERSLAEALVELRKAIALDGNFALAYGLTSVWTALGVDLSLLPDVAAQRTSALEAAERAVALDPNGPEVLGYAGCALVQTGDLPRGRALLERAVELDPSNAQARVALGATQVLTPEIELGIENLRLGIRSSPRDWRKAFWGMVLAEALAKAGQLDEALNESQSVCRRDGRLYMARVVLAFVLTKLGRLEEARAAIVEARRIRPALSLEEVARFFGRRVAAELKSVWT